MKTMNPYFNFNGNTGEAMNFYKSVFGGEFTAQQQFKGMPGCEQMPDADQEKFMHIALTTTGGYVFMATDILESMGQKLLAGNNHYVCVQTDSEAETDRLFEGLSAGGKVEMPVNKTFWGAYCGMCRDKYGIQWMLTYTYEPKS